MKNLNILLALLTAFTITSCKSIKYEADIGDKIIPSGYAQSPEFPVSVNGRICKDVDNIQGFCTIRVKSNESLKIMLANRPYPFKVTIKTSNNISFQKISIDVLPNTNQEIVIPFDTYNNQNVYNVSGEIFPADRPLPVSAIFDIRVRIIDKDYLSYQTPYHSLEKNLSVYGQNSLHTNILYANNVWDYKYKTTYQEKVYNSPCMIITETEKMRFSYYYGKC